MVSVTELYEEALRQLDYDPLEKQDLLLQYMSRFAIMRQATDALIVHGYAGTGKTSLTAAFVKALRSLGLKFVLLAPTGRAAKVLSSFAEQPAYTIHKRLFRGGSLDGSPAPMFQAPCRDVDTLFIIDEASMIPYDADNPLLRQLLSHIYSREGNNAIFIGDTAQLPPVGSEFSAAMHPDTLRQFGLTPTQCLLDQPVRQARKSGILYNATWLRRAMQLPTLPTPQLTISRFSDVESISGEFLAETIADSYSATGQDGTMVITRSNYRATIFNTAIRARVLYAEEQLQRGEKLVVTKNNYYIAKDNRTLGFIANGEIINIQKIYDIESRYGMEFADVEIAIPGTDIVIDTKINLNSLTAETASLPASATTALYNSILQELTAGGGDDPAALSAAIASMRHNPYLEALQVKYAYCLTCHKAQGGQWDNLFIDLSGIAPQAMDLQFYRWLYTAITRTRRHLYLISPSLPCR